MNDRVIISKSKLDALADKINEKVGRIEPLSLDEMIDKVGEKDECRKCLENRSTYSNCFSYIGDNEIPYFTMNPQAGTNARMYWYSKITKLPKFDYSHSFNLEDFCNGCSLLEEVISDTLKPKYCSGMFKGCTSLMKLYTLNLDRVANGFQKDIFYNCKALVEVRFVAETIHWSISFADSPLLSAESVQSIIDGLAPVTTVQTITFHKNIALSDEQKQTINEKGWTLVQ